MVEMLAVIAILLILALLASSGLSSMQEKGKSAKSLENMRQIWFALGQDLMDHEMDYPYFYGSDHDNVYRPWMDVLEPYLPDPVGHGPASADRPNNAVFYCPLEKNHDPWSDYGVNKLVFPFGPESAQRLKSIGINRPSKTILLTTARHLGVNSPKGTGYWWIDSEGFIANPQLSLRPFPRLSGKVGLLFADGHSEAVTPEILELNRAEWLRP